MIKQLSTLFLALNLLACGKPAVQHSPSPRQTVPLTSPIAPNNRWTGYYQTESHRCTSPIDGSTCATEFHDCLRVKSTPSGYLVELMSTQANQHVCAFSIEMSEVGDQLTYESPLGQVLLRNTGSRLVIESDGIDPTASGLGFCGSHADINSLAFPTIDVSRTDAQCFDAESMR